MARSSIDRWRSIHAAARVCQAKIHSASDHLPPDPLPPWESYAQELALILDEVGSQRAALLATLDGPYGAVLCRHQTRKSQRARPGSHHGQVRGRRRRPNRGARTGC